MPTRTYNHPLFGPVTYETENEKEWVRGDHISFIKGFDSNDVTWLVVPQLSKLVHKSRLKFHKKAHAQLLMAFSEIEKAGFLKYIDKCSGSINVRLRKPIPKKGETPKPISKDPSNHAFGIAIDFNSDDGMNGASVAPIAPIMMEYGFTWGNVWKRPDPMHFEVNRFIEKPKPMGKRLELLSKAFG